MTNPKQPSYEQLVAWNAELTARLAELTAGVAELTAGVAQLRTGVTEQAVPIRASVGVASDLPGAVANLYQQIPSPPREKFAHKLSRNWRNIPKSTRAFAAWTIGLILVGTALFLLVTVYYKVTVAFDLLTEHQSPIGEKVGVLGVLLSVFGYFIVPAAIGSVVGAIFAASGRVSARSAERRFEKRAKELYPEASDDQVKRLAAAAYLAESASGEEL